jgi:hypothetical protein
MNKNKENDDFGIYYYYCYHCFVGFIFQEVEIICSGMGFEMEEDR